MFALTYIFDYVLTQQPVSKKYLVRGIVSGKLIESQWFASGFRKKLCWGVGDKSYHAYNLNYIRIY